MKRRKVLKASFSIEAGFILPIIIAVIMLFIYWGIFLYNDNTVQQELYRICFENAHPFFKQERKQLLRENLLSMEKLEITKEIGIIRICVRGKYKMRVPIENYISLFFHANNNEITHQKEAKKTNPVNFIRECRKKEN